MRKSRSVASWAPKAKTDVQVVWRYYTHIASIEVADAMLREVDRVIARLGENPKLGRPRDDVSPQLRSVRAHPYIIFYRLKDEAVEIVRVLHERQDLSTVINDCSK